MNGDLVVNGDAESERLEISKPGFITHGYLTLDGNDNFFIYKTGNNGGGIVLDGNTSSGSKRLYVTRYNHLNFGTGLTPNTYTASFEGKVIATEFTALAINSWPDYVFADEYKLKSLAEVKKFIAENKHLPNIPSAKEIEKNGIQLGDMSNRLMEKVEELTLYIIGLQEQIDELKKNK
jgi:hypothetical protein